MEPQIQAPLSSIPNQKIGILGVVKKAVIAVLLIGVGFGLGTYAAMLAEREQDRELVQQGEQKETPSQVLAGYQHAGASAVAYDNGVVLYLLNHATGEPYCGDHPRYTCKGTLYEISDNKLKEVASGVLGAELIYYKSGAQALLQSRWGDGDCRDIKFYLYDFATASSTTGFAASNCDESTYDEYQKSISNYLTPFGL